MTQLQPQKKLDVGRLVGHYQKRLRSFIRKRVPSETDADDILQEVFYKLAWADAAMMSIEHISGWLYRVVRNGIYDWRRGQKSRRDQFEHDLENVSLEDIGDILTAPGSNPELAYLREQVWYELETALAELPPEQREIFELTEFGGLSYKEIAADQGVAVNTLMSRKRYAVLHLRAKLADLYLQLMMY